MWLILGYAGLLYATAVSVALYQKAMTMLTTTTTLTEEELAEARKWLLDCWSFDIFDIKHFLLLCDEPWLDQDELESWMLGCLSRDLAEVEDFLDNCSDAHIEAAIDEYYQGGLTAFRRSL
ncbi:hypothetical protein IQ217_08490 [Synechocystis salina LEGE 00031]|uniref:Uncharacterized protein n=2 Tax=Synechocystis TaxID=1142 RepID=A0ABR9VUH2_9SYNC|nr:hypothetical protein [Synechocystis salina LEGE 00031]